MMSSPGEGRPPTGQWTRLRPSPIATRDMAHLRTPTTHRGIGYSSSTSSGKVWPAKGLETIDP